jgi:filamentous hemagglutinin
MTVGNALTAVQEQGGAGGKTNVNLFGSAYNAQDAANTVNQMTNGQGQVTSQVHKDDFVGTALGGNAATGGTTPSGSSTLQEWIKMVGGDSTAHNNYGDGKDEKGIKDYWGGVKPVAQLVKPTNALPTLPIGDDK